MAKPFDNVKVTLFLTDESKKIRFKFWYYPLVWVNLILFLG